MTELQSMPPVGVTYSAVETVQPVQAAYPQQTVSYPLQQTVQPLQQPGHPLPPQKITVQHEAPPPAYQAVPAQAIVVTTNSQPPQPAKEQVIVRNAQQQPNDYLALAIIATICCCLPCGIVAIIKSLDVRSKFQRGDYAGAERASKDAKMWGLISLVCGIVTDCSIFLFVGLIQVIGAFTWYAGYDAYYNQNDYWWYY